MIARYTPRTALFEGLMWILALVYLGVPVYLLINVALKGQTDTSPALTPADPVTFDNFRTAFLEGNIGQAFVTSLFITVASVTAVILISAAAAYPLARATRRWSTITFSVFVAGLVVPAVGVIPLYVTMKNLGLLGSPGALVLLYVGMNLPFAILLYTVFLRAVPADYEEAARIDGAGPIRTFWSVVFPLLRPVTGTIAVLTVIAIYNDFFTPLLYLNGSSYTTLPLALRNFSSQYTTNWGAIFAGISLGVLPVLAFYLVLQRNIIKGFAGGLKG
ncbi:carbohydrate ABC transporter permease [Leifsonia sp. ZF2019]|uniref:carbohydrate ABC transporter permease n=1 Tax=Leifsonia sp. ZF2019 TaxID=2781978 RepID=UPI001CC12DE3|nr:carbohydrate ABC transporter permease [Leifsonia sp. ZF2019]UAJ79511.1 carbohydrate ABC transporter permease [Leifsonia sp. ZF2019]